MNRAQLQLLLEQLKKYKISSKNKGLQSLHDDLSQQLDQHFEEHEILKKTLELAYHEMQEMLDLFNKKDLLTKSIFDASQDIILTLDERGQLIEFNQALEVLLKVNGQLSLGKKLIQVLPNCEFSKDLAQFFPEPSGKDHSVEQKIYESSLLSTEGKELRVLVFFKKIILREKVIYPVYIKDLTAEKAAARELEESRSQLMLTSKMSALGEMAGGVAHEINTPLAVIQMRTDQILECVSDGSLDSETLNNALYAIDSTVKRIAKIVSGLRSFARDGRKDPMETASFAKIVDDTFSLCKEKFSIHGVQLDYVAKKDFEIDCRPGEITQVLLNLLNNAYDAIDELSTKWIQVEMKDDENFIYVRVTDSGDGISAEVQKKLMQPFFTTKEVGKGTGLGLSISRGIVESHGGQITLDQSSQNTCFVVSLPKKNHLILNSAKAG